MILLPSPLMTVIALLALILHRYHNLIRLVYQVQGTYEYGISPGGERDRENDTKELLELQ